MLTRSISSGFTLIEVLVGLALLSVLMSLGLPSLNAYIANAKIRAAASNFSASAQFARVQAIRLNARTHDVGGVMRPNLELILTNEAPLAANVDSAVLSTTGKNWMVRSLNAGTTTFTLLEGKAAAEGSQQGSGNSPVVLTGSDSRLGFDGLGGTVPTGTTASFDFSNPSGGACVPQGPMRCLRVQVSAGGQVRLCDPAVTTAGDARTCS
jgi:type IV fimbrial biogenesis protein FimT